MSPVSLEQLPDVIHRDGPAGKRAVVMGGPDVWEIISAVDDARGAAPTLASPDIIDRVCSSTGASARHVHVALDYYGHHPEEIDEIVGDNRRIADALEANMNRRGEDPGQSAFL